MRVVVADATPLHYLILIEAIEILPRIFEKIHAPIELRNELLIAISLRSWLECQFRRWRCGSHRQVAR